VLIGRITVGGVQRVWCLVSPIHRSESCGEQLFSDSRGRAVLGRKERVHVEAPPRFKPCGFWICWMRPASRARGPAATPSSRIASRSDVLAFLDRIGVDAEEPQQARSVVPMRLAGSPRLCGWRTAGPRNYFKIESCMPRLLPGVVDRESGRVAQALVRRRPPPSREPLLHGFVLRRA